MKGSKRKRTAAPKEAPAQPAAVATQIVQPEVLIEVASEVAEVATIVATESIAPPVALAPDAATVTLQANCCVRDAGGLRSSLLEVIESETAVIVDAAQLERIDTAALQVLAAFVLDRRAHQRAVTWANVNDILSEAARTLGLSAVLGMTDSQAQAA
jgi:anti-anti-sigma regulatory factor